MVCTGSRTRSQLVWLCLSALPGVPGGGGRGQGCRVTVPSSPLAGTHFLRVIPDSGPAAQSPEKVKRVLFCTGKVYYDLTRERKARQMEADVAITRVEQVSRGRLPPSPRAGGAVAPHDTAVTPLCLPCSSPPSPSTSSSGKLRSTQPPSWCGARRSTRTRATTTTSNPGSAPPSTAPSQSGRDSAEWL